MKYNYFPRKYFHLIICVTFFVTFFLHACNTSADPSKAPDFTLLDLNNQVVSLSDYKGKVVFLNFFATYCPPCRAEILDLVNLQKRYASKGFSTIGVSVDLDWDKSIPHFVKTLSINYPVLKATEKVIEDYGNVYSLPTSFLISKDQKIIKKFKGPVYEEDLEPLIMAELNLQVK